MKRESHKYYWVNTGGMFNDFLPIYYSENKWRITFQDSTKYVTENTLNLVFGKDCILREVDFKNDINHSPFDTSVIQAIHVKSDNEKDSCFMYYPVLNCIEIHGQLSPFDNNEILGYLTYKQ